MTFDDVERAAQVDKKFADLGLGIVDASIVALSVVTGEVRTIVEGGSSPHYSMTGHLVYARAGDLLTVPFDATALEVTGAPVRVLEGVAGYPGNGSAEVQPVSRRLAVIRSR